MLRYRRYRVFLIFAVVALFALYKFGSSNSGWSEDESAFGQAEAENEEDASHMNWNPKAQQVAQETQKVEIDVPAAKSPRPQHTPPPIEPVSRPVDKVSTASPPSAPKKSGEKVPAAKLPTQSAKDEEAEALASPAEELGEEAAATPTEEVVYWEKLPERFPVASESLLHLPSGTPKKIPKVQFDFKPESDTAKADRLSKLDTIKTVFKRSWDGYRENAWLHDELRPTTGGFKDPFAHWGATLVDSLDTLWIMGMKAEFEEAAKAVDKIDFKTTQRADIPLFETTIRYLGGLIAAYEISEKKYENLLSKAVELAEILISAFDTPNRMPETYYYWKPEYASQARRASNSVVLAELGSLSVEFTRLAQLTGEHKYYDAIARITDALEEFQKNTRLPGMWPTKLDASGCERIDWTKQQQVEPVKQAPLDSNDESVEVASEGTTSTAAAEKLSPGGKKYVPLNLPSPIVLTPNGPNPTWQPPKQEELVWPGSEGGVKEKIKKRQLDVDSEPSPTDNTGDSTPSASESDTVILETPVLPKCKEQGLSSSTEYGSEEYTLGGMSDSTYEYLSKEWMLLGGQVEKYQTMYEQSMDVVKKHLIFRPMLPNEDDILFSGKYFVPSPTNEEAVSELEAENAHLTCFAGGMFGMGAKLFDRPDDLEIAKKLTEGCVWSYSMTSTGIMPEGFIAVPCESTKECTWNETLYYEVLDPRAEGRLESYQRQMETYEQQMASASAWYKSAMAAFTAPATPLPIDDSASEVGAEAKATPTPTVFADTLDKRQLADLEDDVGESNPAPPLVPSSASSSPPSVDETRDSVMGGEEEEGEGPPTKVQTQAPLVGPESETLLPSPVAPSFPAIYSPIPPLTHEEYVKNRIQEERLPIGVSSIRVKNYILRPEAIESVWYLYRITGDAHWREAGWAMFQAVNKHTTTLYGNSAIDDVTKTEPELNDEMESFWLAETLKYFYLLFEDEGVYSLDEWVLNTEAHGFRRPDVS